MKYGRLVLEKKDFVMIKRYQHLNQFVEDYAHKDALESLAENMSNAKIYDLDAMPDEVVRMYSYVTVTSESGWYESFQVVLPPENDTENNKLSVQSTLGASVIGLSEGDSLKYGLPSKLMSLKIEKVEHKKRKLKATIPEEIPMKMVPKHYKKSILLNI